MFSICDALAASRVGQMSLAVGSAGMSVKSFSMQVGGVVDQRTECNPHRCGVDDVLFLAFCFDPGCTDMSCCAAGGKDGLLCVAQESWMAGESRMRSGGDRCGACHLRLPRSSL
jgi:hypothetical protein